MKPTAQIDTCRTSHRRLLDNLAPLADADFREPSLLPHYSRGHLITHIAHKAKAHVAIFEGVAAGETPRLHPVGHDPDQAASAGAGRSASQLRADLSGSFEQLERAWDELEATLWDRQAIMMAGPRTMAEAVDHHLRNVEVHHLDLRIGYPHPRLAGHVRRN